MFRRINLMLKRKDKMKRLKDGTPMWLPPVAIILGGLRGFITGYIIFG